ncbi:MAG: Tex-like N-terminal domain-containing protein [Isosphaeraceae bacterium]
MDNPIPVDLGRVAQDLQIRRVQVESVVQLLDEGNTVPFITRYRKERTGNLNEVVIREIQLRVHRLRELAERKETILKAIEAQGKLNPELEAAIRSAENPKRLEDLYLPFKPKKRTKASDARDKGLEPLAVRVWNRDELLTDPVAAAQEFVSAEKGLETPEKVLEGVGHILAEAISEMAAVRDAVRKVVWKSAKIATSKGDIPEGQGLEYRDYFDYSEPLSQVPPHRVLAINRGDKEGPLKIRLEVPRPELEAAFFHQLPLEGHPQAALFRTAAMDALDRLILPSMEREVRRDLTDAAEKHAVEVFARNLRSLLLQPPIPKQVVLAIDPGLRSGCKVAVLDPHGNLLDHGVVYPHAPQNRRSETKLFLKDLVGRHKVGVVAIGNGTACRETEELVAEIIAEGTQFSQGEPSPQETGDAQAPGDSVHQEPGVAAVGEIETPESPPAGHHAIVEQAIATAEGRQPSASLEPEHSVPPSGLDHHELASSGSPELSAADNSHAVRHEALTVPELNEETLPPITGGAPEPASPEAETESDMAPTPGDGETATAPHHERPDNSEQNHALSTSTRADGETRSDKPSDASAGAEVHEAASAEQVAHSVSEPSAPEQGPEAGSIAGNPPVNSDKAIEAGQSDAFAAGPAPVEGATEGADASSAAPAGLETQAAAGAPAPPAEAKPPHESRRGGSGKHNHGRSRGSRPKPSASAPPPPTPPAPHAADPLLAQLAYVIVNEAGASVYSTSQIGREELPEFDATLRSAISIGRRLQDPLAELVKIEPQNIGVGLYQHDVNPKQLKETLEAVISSCVNFVGVDLNTASVPLLRHVSGLNQLTARRIVDYRKDKGTFATREQLMEVDGVGPATYTQAAGFLKIPEGVHPLDRTWIHPESYAIATLLLERFGKTPEVVRDKQELPELHRQLEEAAASELAKELQVGEFTLRDIIEALGRPERDPRDDLPKPIFKKGILKLEDLIPAMELKGTVLNVVDFGAFVDIGLKDSGLVHISQLANRYIKTPHDVVSVGDVVTVWVMSVDQERKRVSLTMVKPGTERQRGAAQGGQRRGHGGGEQREGQAGQGQGQGRRDRARPPRPSGSALTSPPVGAAPIAALAEPPARRPDRDRGGAPGSQGHAGPPEGGAGQGPGPGPVSGQAFPGNRPGPGFPGPAGSGRGGPRGGPFVPGPGGARPGPGRQERPQGQRGPSRPSRPSPPPPPLSKEALAGSVPLRTFGQLKQLWEARVDATPEELAAAAAAAEAAQARAGQPQGEPSEVAIPPGDSTHPEQAHPESAPSAEPNSGANETQ